MPYPHVKSLERTSYITPDGVEYMFVAPTYIIDEDGLGMPPIEYVTQRGPFQHGETVKDFFLRPRTIQLIVRRNGCSRAEFRSIRSTILDILRPGRQGLDPGRLRKYLADGRVVDFDVYVSQGPGFENNPNQWDEYSIQTTIRFTAYNPIGRDSVAQSLTFISSGVISSFPITFPFQIASFGSTSTNAVNNGTWETFPTITITGPASGPLIRNITTDEKLELAYTIPTGFTVTFDLAYGHKTVTRDDGLNLVGYLTGDSDLGTFHLQPGTNQMQIFATGTSAITSIVLSWFKQYLGV